MSAGRRPAARRRLRSRAGRPAASVLPAVLVVLAAVAGLVGGAAVAQAGPRESAPGEWEDVPRVVAVGDVHGSFDKLVAILTASGLADADLNWTGAADHLVLVGDYTDRGEREREVLDLLRRLQDQSVAAGGRVHTLLGNHEVMNLVRDLRYVQPAGFAAFAGEERARERKALRRAWVDSLPEGGTARDVARDTFDKRFPPGFLARSREFEDGELGVWLSRQPVAVKINGVVFVHGGIHPGIARLGIDTLNRMASDGLRAFRDQRRVLEDAGRVPATSYYRDHQATAREILAAAEAGGDADPALTAAAEGVLALGESPIFGTQGPLWHRAYAIANERYEREHLASALEALAARAMVVGHSIAPRQAIGARFNRRLFLADVGMAYEGPAQALIVSGPTFRVLDAADGSLHEPPGEAPAGELEARDPLDDAQLEALLQEGPLMADRVFAGPETQGARVLHVRRDGVSATGAFWGTDDVASHRRATQELAAFGLDRLLGLKLVPLTTVREVAGVAGAVQHVDDGALDGQSIEDYAIELWDAAEVARLRDRARVFDTLVGNCRRPSTEALYLPQERRMLLVNHSRAFAISLLAGCGEDAPRPAIDAELETALQALTVESLTAALGGWLNEQQIAALLVRRDRLLGAEPAGAGRPAAPAGGGPS